MTRIDLLEMKRYGLEELERFTTQQGNGKYSAYKRRLAAICLCQGAARHFLDGTKGVRDVDIWLFFLEHTTVKIPHRRNMRSQGFRDFTNLGNKPVDFMKKMIPSTCWEGADIKQTIENYLCQSKTQTARELSKQPVIGLFPDHVFAKLLWKP